MVTVATTLLLLSPIWWQGVYYVLYYIYTVHHIHVQLSSTVYGDYTVYTVHSYSYSLPCGDYTQLQLFSALW